MDRIFILQYRSGLDTRNPSAPCHTRFPRHAGHGFRPGHHHPGPRRLRHRLHRIPDRRPDPALARDFGVSVPQAGQLVALFAFTVMLAGPPLTAALAHVERKRLFVAILLVFAGANALAALAPNLWVLALARFILRWRCRCSGARPARPPRAHGRAAARGPGRVARLPGHLRRPAVRHPDRHAGGGRHRLARQLLGLAALSLLLAALMARHMPALSQSARTPCATRPAS